MKKHRLFISNNTFYEQKTKDLSVAENIDYCWLLFLINGNNVVMPDLES